MSLLYRLVRAFGKDTTIEVEQTEPMFEYTIEQTSGDTRVIEANGVRTSGTMAYFYKYTEPFPVKLIDNNFWLHEESVFVCGSGSILSIEREQVSEETWAVTFDKATDEMVEWVIK